MLVAAASSSVACATRSTRAFSHLSTPRLGAPSAARVDGSSQLSRRAALGGALALGLVPTRSLAAFPKLFGPTVEVLAQPKVSPSCAVLRARPSARAALTQPAHPRPAPRTRQACQSRTLRDDFVRVRYEGRRQDGTPVDVRYRDRDLVFQLGDAFYLPGFSQALTGVCTGATYRLSWGGAPALSEAEQAVLPPGTPIVYDVQLLRCARARVRARTCPTAAGTSV